MFNLKRNYLFGKFFENKIKVNYILNRFNVFYWYFIIYCRDRYIIFLKVFYFFCIMK